MRRRPVLGSQSVTTLQIRMFLLTCVLLCGACAMTVSAAAAVPAEEETRPVMAAADAKISPSGVLLFRFKREPQRAMTFSGFMPNGGMTAFSAAADSYRPSWYSKPTGPSDMLTPPGESDQPAEAVQEEPSWGKKSKKKHPTKYYPSQTTQDEDEEEYEPPTRSRSKGSSATASFNAWFPIMFGTFPGSGGQYNRQAGQEGSKSAGDSSYSPYSRSSDFPGQTVIANSVSNGKGGVASSHAVAYGNGPEGRNYGGSGAMEPKMQQQSYY